MPRQRGDEVTPRKFVEACPRCGGAFVDTETGRQCLNCGLTEWINEGGEYTSGVAKCPHCGSCSPNLRHCPVCGGKIS